MATNSYENQAQSMSELITPLQLQQIFCAATAVSLDAFYVSEQMFHCPVSELNQEAADELLGYFEEMKHVDEPIPMSRLAREQRRREQEQAILIKPQPRSMGRLDGIEI